MTETKTLLKLRNANKKKKPHFVRKDSHKKSRVSSKWRKPRGKQSPVRQKHRGRPKLVSPGFGSPKAVKHLHSSGLQPVIIRTKKELASVDSKTQGIVLSKTLGNKKRIELIKLALEKKISVLNLKDPQKHMEKLESQFKTRQTSKKKKTTEKEKKDQEKKKAAEEKAEKEKQESKDKKSEEKTAEKVKEEEKAETKTAEKTIIKKQ
ncbi:50S ribosomal protein L32e [Candidatus Woesearchaeota archaeon]|nr:50S ribosomal protein L32e [Candidatus Woesearchaeota archaeon]